MNENNVHRASQRHSGSQSHSLSHLRRVLGSKKTAASAADHDELDDPGEEVQSSRSASKLLLNPHSAVASEPGIRRPWRMTRTLTSTSS